MAASLALAAMVCAGWHAAAPALWRPPMDWRPGVLASTRHPNLRMEVFVVASGAQLETVISEYRRADGVVVLYFTELSHTVPNEQFEYLADLYAQQDPNDRHPVIFIQVTRDDPMQAVLCSQRGVTAFPQVEVWRDGVRRSCLDGLAGVMRLPEVLSDLGVSASASSSNRIQTGRSSKAPPTRADGSSWSQW